MPQSIRIYRLVPPGVVADNEAELARTIFGMSGPREARRVFGVSPQSGWLFYADYGALWQNSSGSGLSSDPAKAAGAFLRNASARVAARGKLRKAGLDRILPDGLELRDTQAVLNPSKAVVDHWLCRYYAFLSSGIGEDPVPVVGALLEVRIGRNDVIIGLWSRWRTCSGDESVTRILSPAANGTSGGTSSAQDNSLPLTYVLDDETAPQTFLLPYYELRDDDNAIYFPASSYSLVVQLFQRRNPSGDTDVSALVVGGSGKYRFSWATWDPGNLDGGIEAVGDDIQIKVSAGTRQVALVVEDEVTGVVKQVECAIHGIAAPEV